MIMIMMMMIMMIGMITENKSSLFSGCTMKKKVDINMTEAFC